jgi:hypothetical protein
MLIAARPAFHCLYPLIRNERNHDEGSSWVGPPPSWTRVK